jgi:undecaprenyl-diphosphatase
MLRFLLKFPAVRADTARDAQLAARVEARSATRRPETDDSAPAPAPRPGDGAGDSDVRIAKLSWRQAIAVGTAQALALIPGFSRSGATMGGGLLVGLSNEDAARYSFLLATPIIGAAAALKLPELLGKSGHVIGTALVGAACAAVTAYLSVRFLLRYFETNTLTPFAVYCVIAGTLCTIGFALT